MFSRYTKKKIYIPFQIKRLSVSTTEYFFLDILFWELPFCLFIQNVQPLCNCHNVYFRYFVPNQSVSRLTLNWALHMIAVIVIFMCSRFPGVIGSTADSSVETSFESIFTYFVSLRRMSLCRSANEPVPEMIAILSRKWSRTKNRNGMDLN